MILGFQGSANSLNRWKKGLYDFITEDAPVVETGELIGIKDRSIEYEGTELRNYWEFLYST